ncbi:hypothetical protein NNJEOMEG_01224 [Fundidesulfovibrio magnetotacticus]|uniref:SnoaL-like domain-containing protein n=1 Tax=Fundidesulfovibrio magnetotacticus TaxID=2730080 RepID=A0A6V8LL11_9BACT|nr:nuclear transport factor 2 family protein [Fundidesulfovibrio magnetotacticus]GFK93392.1 hypothetical protein NNJEOMEG_01224 [Fundidesulfovibrio magnetotacticus]
MNNTPKELVEVWIAAANAADLEAFAACFAPQARVVDAGSEYSGLEAIKCWAERDIAAVNLRLELLDLREQDGETTFITRVDGDFDKTGLPDPVLIHNRAVIRQGRIERLTCRLHAPDTGRAG